VAWTRLPALAAACGLIGCAPGLSSTIDDGGDDLDAGATDSGSTDAGSVDAGSIDAGAIDAGDLPDAGIDGGTDGGVDGGVIDAGCYSTGSQPVIQTQQANRDRLIADLARRKGADSCSLWAALNLAERDVFLMVTGYLGDPSSRLYPPSLDQLDTALDHAESLYSINGPKAGQGVDHSGRGGLDYNRVYLGFDSLGECVMRNFAAANPARTAGYNLWQKSDDLAGPHAPFTQREMIFWYRAFYDLNSNGPQFHHWALDADFDGGALDQRLGVCGVTDRSLSELTIAFDTFHNSDPLGDYAGRGGYGWQIVDLYLSIDPDWSYTPSGCAPSAPVNTDPYGGGTFAGMGPVLDGGVCTSGLLE
jgi:hypothetical protein